MGYAVLMMSEKLFAGSVDQRDLPWLPCSRKNKIDILYKLQSIMVGYKSAHDATTYVNGSI